MKRRFPVRGAWVAAAWLVCLSVAAGAQDSANPNDSLGDLARQTRAQHASANEGKSSKAQDLVDEMQQEQEAEENAPLGFKNYNAGDYRLFVPFPFSLEGRDNGGAVLLGSRLGVTNTEVMAGIPVPIPANLSDNELSNLVDQIARQHSQNSGCGPIKLGERRAFHCGVKNTYLLGHQVTGTMMVVVGSNSLIPVMCVSPDEMTEHLVYGNPRASYQQKQAAYAQQSQRFRDEMTTGQMCDQIIYPSIHLKEDTVVHRVSISGGKAAKAAAVPRDDSVVAAGSQTSSLADLARRTRQAPHGTAQATLDSTEGTSAAPAGYQSFALRFCQNPQQCSEASVVIPEKAEVVSSTNGQHVFKTVLNGNPVMLYAGPADVNDPYRSLTAPDYIRMRDLANSNGWSREKADGVSTQELTIEGKFSLLTRFRYQRDQKAWWIGERVLIQNRGAQFLLGCTSPEAHFADAEVLCTTLVNSLRLP